MKGTQKGLLFFVKNGKKKAKGLDLGAERPRIKAFLVPLRGFSAFLPTTTVKRVKLVVTEADRWQFSNHVLFFKQGSRAEIVRMENPFPLGW